MKADKTLRIDGETLKALHKLKGKEPLAAVVRRILGLSQWTGKRGRPKKKKEREEVQPPPSSSEHKEVCQ